MPARGHTFKLPTVELSQRETELCELLTVECLTVKEAAERLGIAPNTAETHLSNVYRKLRINNRAQLSRVFSKP